MKCIPISFVSAVGIFLLAQSWLEAEDLTVATARPVVVKCVPEAGTVDVDPAVNEIRVTFSKDMKDGNWSWCAESKESYPKMAGDPKFLQDKRTCVLPVKLEAGRSYAVWVNCEKFHKFQDPQGRIAFPYLLVFKTKS